MMLIMKMSNIFAVAKVAVATDTYTVLTKCQVSSEDSTGR